MVYKGNAVRLRGVSAGLRAARPGEYALSDNVRDDVTSAMDPSSSTVNVPSAEGVDGVDPLIGRTIDGKYVVEALVGVGGMGRVYRGRNTRTDSPVAIKTLLPDLIADNSLVERFEIEAKAASNLRHPNTIRVYDFGREGDLFFMVMELLDGQSMEGLLQREGKIDPVRLLHIVQQASRSLDEAHASGLVHRDIKPDNIFLNRVGDDVDQVKVLDFGVAKLQNNQFGNSTLTQAGMIFGTPRYMSPEQARAFELTGKSDIYALGVVMYEALTGKPPFVANDPVGVLIMHVNEPPPPFATANPDLPPLPEFEALVMRCLAKDPNDRFDNIRNLLNALEGVAQSMGVGLGGTSANQVAAGPMNTRAMSSQHTPPKLLSDAFNHLGVPDGPMPPSDSARSRYTMGAQRSDVPSAAHAVARSPVLRIAVALGVLVLVSGVALMLLIGGDDTPEPVPTPTGDPVAVNAEQPAGEGTGGTPPAQVGPMTELARMHTYAAFQGAVAAASARVVTIEVRATPADAPAMASVEGMEAAPVALPHTFVFTRDPASPPVDIRFNVVAEGYRDATETTRLARTEVPLTVALRRRSSGSSSSSGGVAVPPPRERNNGAGNGLDDPYRNR